MSCVLLVGGSAVTLQDPSGGTFDAAGDFDRLLDRMAELPVLCRFDPDYEVVLTPDEMRAAVGEVDLLLPESREGPERRGLLRLRGLLRHGVATTGSVLVFTGN